MKTYTKDDLDYGDTELAGYTVKIEQDSDAESSRAWDNVGTMVCWHRNYILGDEQPSADPLDYMLAMLHAANPRLDIEAFVEALDGGDAGRAQLDAALEEHFLILPLILYDHSGISMSTSSSEYPYNDRWDAGQVGFIYAALTKLEEEGITDGAATLKGEVDTYDQYLRGEVYGYSIEDTEGEHVDSCWGFYGSDYAMEQAAEALNYAIEEKHKEHIDDVKTWIRHKVPLHVRQELSQA